jgi:hypothetical protein
MQQQQGGPSPFGPIRVTFSSLFLRRQGQLLMTQENRAKLEQREPPANEDS